MFARQDTLSRRIPGRVVYSAGRACHILAGKIHNYFPALGKLGEHDISSLLWTRPDSPFPSLPSRRHLFHIPMDPSLGLEEHLLPFAGSWLKSYMVSSREGWRRWHLGFFPRSVPLGQAGGHSRRWVSDMLPMNIYWSPPVRAWAVDGDHE